MSLARDASGRGAGYLISGLATSFLLLMLLSPWLVEPARADSLDDGVRRIARQLRCPICESVSVADSPADLAVQMRGLIRKRLEESESDEQIIDYFVLSYGDSVLLDPPRRGLGWMIWLAPIAALGAGAAGLAMVLRSWLARGQDRRRDHERSRPAASGSTTETDRSSDQLELAQRELAALRQGRGA